jgi:hypothetical protein
VLVLWRNYKWSPPELKDVNRFLFVLFISSILFFCTVFGCFYLELALFTGIAGLSVSINGGVRSGVLAPRSAPIPLPFGPAQGTSAAARQPAGAT